MRRIPDSALDELRARHNCADWAAARVRLRPARGRMVGPCPICSADTASRTATRFEAFAERWVCAACPDGGDIIKLVMRADGLGFAQALEALGAGDLLGKPAPRDPQAQAEAQARRAAQIKRRMEEEAEEHIRRARKLAWLTGLVKGATPIGPATPAGLYLAGRGIDVAAACRAGLRLASARVPYLGPCARESADALGPLVTMFAAFRNAGAASPAITPRRCNRASPAMAG